MVQQQEAEKAIFAMRQAKTDAESTRIQGEALEKARKLVELKVAKKRNGVAPQVVGSCSNILLPLGKAQERGRSSISALAVP